MEMAENVGITAFRGGVGLGNEGIGGMVGWDLGRLGIGLKWG